jgi:hypothetical protein
MAGSSSAMDRFVALQDGLVMPAEPYRLALELEERGFQLSRDGHFLVVQPSTRLTSFDCRRLRQWKWHLLILVDYVQVDRARHLWDAP